MNTFVKVNNRESNIELFRIIATILVLIFHFNGWFLGGIPEISEVSIDNPYRIGQAIIHSLSVCCVNCFLIISGFFGIKLKLTSICKLLFQLIGIFVPFYLLAVVLDYSPFSIVTLVHSFLPISRGGYFVECYIFLMLLSPFINGFIRQNCRKTILFYAILFAGFELWFDCVLNEKYVGFLHGYSTLHFCEVYLIGRTMQLYKDKLILLPRFIWGFIYLMCACGVFIMYTINVPFAFYYSNSLVICSAISLFMIFLYKSYDNRMINLIATGCFAVYMIQVIDPAFTILCNIDRDLLNNNSYVMYLIKAGAVIGLFFFICVLYDNIRSLLTQPIEDIIYPKLNMMKEKIRLRNNN